MKSLTTSLRPLQNLKTTLARTALTLGLLGLGSSLQATSTQSEDDQKDNTQVAEILDLLANFHGALSYGGNITAMMNLWTDDGSITLNGVAHVGKDQVQAFFLGGGYFLHNWVSLAPEYKTKVTVHGDTAEAATQCVAIDLTATPMTVRGVIQVSARMIKVNGQWLFNSMNNTSPAPL